MWERAGLLERACGRRRRAGRRPARGSRKHAAPRARTGRLRSSNAPRRRRNRGRIQQPPARWALPGERVADAKLQRRIVKEQSLVAQERLASSPSLTAIGSLRVHGASGVDSAVIAGGNKRSLGSFLAAHRASALRFEQAGALGKLDTEPVLSTWVVATEPVPIAAQAALAIAVVLARYALDFLAGAAG